MRRESGVTVKDLKLKEVIPMMRRSRITFIIDVIIVMLYVYLMRKLMNLLAYIFL